MSLGLHYVSKSPDGNKGCVQSVKIVGHDQSSVMYNVTTNRPSCDAYDQCNEIYHDCGEVDYVPTVTEIEMR